MVERIEIKKIMPNTQPAGRVTPSKNAERDEKKKHFNQELQKELKDKNKKEEKKEEKNFNQSLSQQTQKLNESPTKKRTNLKENNFTEKGKIDIYI